MGEERGDTQPTTTILGFYVRHEDHEDFSTQGKTSQASDAHTTSRWEDIDLPMDRKFSWENNCIATYPISIEISSSELASKWTQLGSTLSHKHSGPGRAKLVDQVSEDPQ